MGVNRPVALRQAMFVDFGMAEQYGGDCYLRYDDTNPEAEKMEFIEHIQDIVAWLGWKPAKARTSRPGGGWQRPSCRHCIATCLLAHGPANHLFTSKCRGKPLRCVSAIL